MAVDIHEGASRIAQLLQPEQPSDSAPEEAETMEVEEVEEVVSDEPESNGEPDEVEEAEPEQPRHRVKVNGEEIEVSIDDLRKGYMMEADYRKKTSDVARMRDEAKQKLTEIESKVADAELVLKLEIEDLNSEENQDLKEYDRTAYEEKVDKVKAKLEKLEKLKQATQENKSKSKQEEIAKQKEALLTALPDWLDEAKLSTESKMINELWSDYNFSQEELNEFTDHRLILISREAALYRKLKNAKPESHSFW